MLKQTTTGILLQGNIRSWTIPIIEEHQQNFPESEIILSTWDDEDISNIPCEVIQTKIPDMDHKYPSSKNYQIIGSQSGLKTMKSDIILKTRTDMFVHNPNIFKIFLVENSQEKIMYPYSGFTKESRDYWITDFCQLSSRETLLDYWNSMPSHDGVNNTSAENYFTRNYILNTCSDDRPWNVVHDEYFIRKRYHEDFQIEFEKYVNNESYQNYLVSASMENELDNRLSTLQTLHRDEIK